MKLLCRVCHHWIDVGVKCPHCLGEVRWLRRHHPVVARSIWGPVPSPMIEQKAVEVVVEPSAGPPRPRRRQIGQKLRFQILRRDGFHCVYCGAQPFAAYLHLDHVISVADGGSTTEDNLVTACAACNLGKGATSLYLTGEHTEGSRP